MPAPLRGSEENAKEAIDSYLELFEGKRSLINRE